ncbi:uncharacterized protein LOC124467761 isoform X2 [Hypomesus transpacificus]|uniref:uncharacterized protein LOC124467761 isoform X2 n=1 Tax=Hypomesus transpacificus TaxID=137520 RepID=UPI001F0873F0|nr:uncharacterized protein LOC124467761 isoform X2 [Hypomesus transpacificus]
MELSQRKWVEMSDYEDATNIQQTTYGPESKTEDIYQTLQSPALNVVRLEEGRQLPVRLRHPAFLLSSFVTILLLVVILIIVGVHYHQLTDSVPPMNRVLGQGDEVWFHHQRIFYLFWEGEGDCSSAQHFCKQRNTTLATLNLNNKDWVLLRAKGQRLWVMDDLTEGSADDTGSTPFYDDDDYYDGDILGDSDDSVPGCGLLNLSPPPDSTEPSQGWVCQVDASSPGCTVSPRWKPGLA